MLPTDGMGMKGETPGQLLHPGTAARDPPAQPRRLLQSICGAEKKDRRQEGRVPCSAWKIKTKTWAFQAFGRSEEDA